MVSVNQADPFRRVSPEKEYIYFRALHKKIFGQLLWNPPPKRILPESNPIQLKSPYHRGQSIFSEEVWKSHNSISEESFVNTTSNFITLSYSKTKHTNRQRSERKEKETDAENHIPEEGLSAPGNQLRKFRGAGIFHLVADKH